MADYKLLIPHIHKWEGGVSDDPLDSGGFTNKGITIGTWRMHGYDNDHDGDIDDKDLRKVTREQWEFIFKYQYWNRANADSLIDQLIANIIVDWLWNSGFYALKNAQIAANSFGAGLVIDGQIGRKSVTAINAIDPLLYSRHLHQIRLDFYQGLAQRKPSQKRFLKGWINRSQDLVKDAPWMKPGYDKAQRGKSVSVTEPIPLSALHIPNAAA